MQSTMPHIFESSTRYSAATRPAIGEICFFSHAEMLISNEFVPKTKAFLHERIKQNASVKVVRNLDRITEVLFDGAVVTDLVSPEFLISRSLTNFGKAFFHQNKSTMSAQTRKFFGVKTNEKH